MADSKTYGQIVELLGGEADSLLQHKSQTIPKEQLYLPGPDFIDRVWIDSDRNPQVLRSLQTMFSHGRLAGTGYLSILPVDQGIEHSAGASFAPNPIYFDPKQIVELAIQGGCNAVASTYGVLGAIARRYAHKIPMMLKFNHNELLTYPNVADQVIFARVQDAWNMGCVSVGATVYYGSNESKRQLQEVSLAFAKAHELGMSTVLWCYTRNDAFTVKDAAGKKVNHETSADLTGQANHLGVTIEADIIKQKQPTQNGGYKALNTGGSSYGKFDERVYTKLASDHPIDLTRYQLANCYMGRCGLINSGGASAGDKKKETDPQADLKDAVKTAVINKRAGGMGLISGRKAFQAPMKEGAALLQAIQDVYRLSEITIA